jgi:hypothetical protein
MIGSSSGRRRRSHWYPKGDHHPSGLLWAHAGQDRGIGLLEDFDRRPTDPGLLPVGVDEVAHEPPEGLVVVPLVGSVDALRLVETVGDSASEPPLGASNCDVFDRIVGCLRRIVGRDPDRQLRHPRPTTHHHHRAIRLPYLFGCRHVVGVVGLRRSPRRRAGGAFEVATMVTTTTDASREVWSHRCGVIRGLRVEAAQ